MKPKIPELTGVQRKLLTVLAGGGYLDIGQNGGFLPFVYNAHNSNYYLVHGSTVRAVSKRGYIEQVNKRLVITDAGRKALQ